MECEACSSDDKVFFWNSHTHLCSGKNNTHTHLYIDGSWSSPWLHHKKNVVNYELMLKRPIINPTTAFKLNRIVDQWISFFQTIAVDHLICIAKLLKIMYLLIDRFVETYTIDLVCDSPYLSMMPHIITYILVILDGLVQFVEMNQNVLLINPEKMSSGFLH